MITLCGCVLQQLHSQWNPASGVWEDRMYVDLITGNPLWLCFAFVKSSGVFS